MRACKICGHSIAEIRNRSVRFCSALCRSEAKRIKRRRKDKRRNERRIAECGSAYAWLKKHKPGPYVAKLKQRRRWYLLNRDRILNKYRNKYRNSPRSVLYHAKRVARHTIAAKRARLTCVLKRFNALTRNAREVRRQRALRESKYYRQCLLPNLLTRRRQLRAKLKAFELMGLMDLNSIYCPNELERGVTPLWFWIKDVTRQTRSERLDRMAQSRRLREFKQTAAIAALKNQGLF